MYIDNIKLTKQHKVVRYQEANNVIDSCSMTGKRNEILGNKYPPVIVINPYNYTLCA